MAIRSITVGMHIRLPSGNVLRVVRCTGREWVCEYTEHARARGEVVYTGAFLRKFGRAV